MAPAHIPRRVLIIGATGQIGTFITRSIVDQKAQFEKIGIFTSADSPSAEKEEKIRGLKAEGVAIICGDVTKEDDVRAAYEGYDTVVSCLGRGALQQQEQLISLAAESPSIKRFFPSEYGADIAYDETSLTEKSSRFKLIVRRVIEPLAAEGKLEYTYVVVGPYADGDKGMYLGNTIARDAGFWDVPEKQALLLGDGNGRISLTSMRDTGRFVAAALLHPEASRNKALTCNSFTTTPNEILKEFEKQTGAKWQASYLSIDTLKEKEKAAWEAQASNAAWFTLRRTFTEGKTLYERRSNADIEVEDDLDTLESAVRQTVAAHK